MVCDMTDVVLPGYCVSVIAHHEAATHIAFSSCLCERNGRGLSSKHRCGTYYRTRNLHTRTFTGARKHAWNHPITSYDRRRCVEESLGQGQTGRATLLAAVMEEGSWVKRLGRHRIRRLGRPSNGKEYDDGTQVYCNEAA
jgi:hypothetical protein